MRREGHIGINIIISSPIIGFIIYHYGIYPAILFGLIMFWTSVIPDWDIKLQRMPILKKMPYINIKHRGFTHTIWFAILMGLFLTSIVYGISTEYNIDIIYLNVTFISGFLGILSHSIGDILTPTGINIIPPLQSSNISLNLFYYDNTISNYGFPIVSIITLFTSLYISKYYNTLSSNDIITYVSINILLVLLVMLFGKLINHRLDNKKPSWFTNYVSIRYIIKKIIPSFITKYLCITKNKITYIIKKPLSIFKILL